MKPSSPTNWPRPGTEWDANITFPSAGCWHVHAQGRDVTGDMWFEVSRRLRRRCPTTGRAAMTSVPDCAGVSDLVPNADFGGYGLAQAGPLWFSDFGLVQSGKAVITDFNPGYPTKVVIHQMPAFTAACNSGVSIAKPDSSCIFVMERGTVDLTGNNCRKRN